MLILLDVGNTAVTYGIYDGGRLLYSGSSLYNHIPKIVKNWSKSGRDNNSVNIIISSVVPKITPIIRKSIKGNKRVKIWVVRENLPIPIKHKYRNIKQLGIDRAVDIYGALRMYKAPLLILDFGTAITADYVSKKGVFEGGMIIPGPQISFQALIARGALLPKNLRLPRTHKSFLGRNTYDCMASGILEGYGALTDELISRFKKRFGKNLRVIATGGFAEHLKPYVHPFDIYDPRHSIKSLLLLAKDYGLR